MEKAKNILLIQMTTSKWYRRAKIFKPAKLPPIGLYYLSAYLKTNGIMNVRVIDFRVNPLSKEEFSNLLIEQKIDVVGLSIYAESYRHAIELADYIKNINKSIKVVAGGAFVTHIPRELLGHKSFDFVVIGEGEVTLLELLLHFNYPEHIPLMKIRGLAYRENDGQIIINESRTFIKSLDALPFYDRTQENFDYYEPAINSSRGCPSNCIYCSARAFWGGKYRMRSAENVFNEVYYLYKKHGKITKLNFTEDTFTASARRILALCRLIKESRIEVGWWCESRVDVLTKEILEEMKEAGLVAIQIGIESAVQEIIDEIRKNITLEKVLQVLDWTRELGLYRVHCGFMIGHPSDTAETVQKTIDFAHFIQKKYNVSVEVAINTPFPGTYEFNNAEELGLKIHTTDWNQYVLEHAVIDTKFLTKNDLQKYLIQFRLKTRSNLAPNDYLKNEIKEECNAIRGFQPKSGLNKNSM